MLSGAPPDARPLSPRTRRQPMANEAPSLASVARWASRTPATNAQVPRTRAIPPVRPRPPCCAQHAWPSRVPGPCARAGPWGTCPAPARHSLAETVILMGSPSWSMIERLERGPDVVRGSGGVLAGAVHEHCHELLATVSSGDVPVAEPVAQQPRELAQHGIARLMAVLLVDLAEAIEVEHDGRGRTDAIASAQPTGDDRPERPVEPGPVVETREGVVGHPHREALVALSESVSLARLERLLASPCRDIPSRGSRRVDHPPMEPCSTPASGRSRRGGDTGSGSHARRRAAANRSVMLVTVRSTSSGWMKSMTR